MKAELRKAVPVAKKEISELYVHHPIHIAEFCLYDVRTL